MSEQQLATREERMALLRARAELNRTRISLALDAIGGIVAPARDTARVARARPVAAMLVSVLAPMVGAARVGRWVRIASLAHFAYRVARNWSRVR